MMSPEGIADAQKVRAEIADEILRVHNESYGTGASKIEVHLLENLVVVVMDIELAPSEETLLGAERGDAVKATREAFQQVIAPTFDAIVERATGRRVQSFLSSVSLDPLYAVELFRLEPHAT